MSYFTYRNIIMVDRRLPHCYQGNCIASLITNRCITITGYEDIDESKMGDFPSKTQHVGCTPHSSAPPPIPTRSGTQEPNREAGIKPDLNSANEVDGDDVSGYEYVSNPMKVNNKKTSNGCNERKTASVEINPNQHNDNSAPYGTLNAEHAHYDKGGKRRDICSAYEENGDTSSKHAYQKLIEATMCHIVSTASRIWCGRKVWNILTERTPLTATIKSVPKQPSATFMNTRNWTNKQWNHLVTC